MADGQDNDEIKKLPIKERLECKRIQAETREHEKSIWRKPAIYGVIAPIALAVAIYFYTDKYLGWFDVQQKNLETEKILLGNKKVLLEIKNENLEREFDDKNIKLVKKYEDNTAKLEREFEDKKVKLDEEYEERLLVLKEKEAKLIKEKALLNREIKKLKKKVEDMSSFGNLYSRGAGEFIDKKYEKAIATFTKALETKPDKKSAAYTYNYMGLANYKRNKPKESIESYTKAIELYAEYSVAYINRGNVYARLKEYKHAWKDYKKAIEFYIIKGEYEKTEVTIRQSLQGIKALEIDENMKKSIEDDIAKLKKQLEDSKK